MPVLQFKGKTAVESYHHVVPHHCLEFDLKLSLLNKGEKPSLEGNLIIEGDNLLALKALLPTHAGKVKCIYINPPFYESLLLVKLWLRMMNCQCGDPILLSERLPKDSPSGCFDDLLRLPYLQTSMHNNSGWERACRSSAGRRSLNFINPQMQCSL